MKTKTLLAAILSGLLSNVAVASDEASATAEQTIQMKDGSTLYIFKDGKMAMKNQYGRAVSMKEGEVMETKEGREVIMIGNQVAYLERLINRGHRGGGGR
jgi:hypothetical protein